MQLFHHCRQQSAWALSAAPLNTSLLKGCLRVAAILATKKQLPSPSSSLFLQLSQIDKTSKQRLDNQIKKVKNWTCLNVMSVQKSTTNKTCHQYVICKFCFGSGDVTTEFTLLNFYFRNSEWVRASFNVIAHMPTETISFKSTFYFSH